MLRSPACAWCAYNIIILWERKDMLSGCNCWRPVHLSKRGLLARAAAGSAEPQRGDPPLGTATADEPGARGTAGMIDAPRALKVTQALLRKTVANGCTPSEATAAADRGAAYMQRFGFTLEEATRGVRMPTQACSAPAAPPFTPTTLPPRLEPFRWRPAAQTIGWVISGLGLFCAYCLAW
jgi:hypothetical protein